MSITLIDEMVIKVEHQRFMTFYVQGVGEIVMEVCFIDANGIHLQQMFPANSNSKLMFDNLSKKEQDTLHSLVCSKLGIKIQRERMKLHTNWNGTLKWIPESEEEKERYKPEFRGLISYYQDDNL